MNLHHLGTIALAAAFTPALCAQSWLDQRTSAGPSWAQQRTSPVSSPRRVQRPAFSRQVQANRPTVGHHGDNGGFVSGSGLSVNGQYSSGNWDVAFHLGSGLGYHNNGGVIDICRPDWCGNTSYCNTYYPYWSYPGYYSSYWYYPQPVVSGIYTGVDPYMTVPTPAMPSQASVGQQAQATPPEPLDVARTYVALGASGRAVPILESHLKETPDDARAMRILAIALLDDKRALDAAAMMRLAYQTDPALAMTPASAGELNLGTARLRNLVNRAVTLAHKQQSGSSWLLVAVLMQSQGKPDNAARMLERAREAGLTKEIVDPLAGSLRRN